MKKSLPAKTRKPNELLRFQGPDDSIIKVLEHVSGVKKTVAKKILLAYPKGRGLPSATINSLVHLGATEKQAKAIHHAFKLQSLCDEACQAMADESLSGPNDVVRFLLAQIRSQEQESFGVVLLDKKKRPVETLFITKGGLASVEIHPRDAFREAVRLGGINAIILFHNHPGGSPEPSSDDIKLTRRFVEAGMTVGIPVLDHIIIARGGHTSFRAQGLIF